MTLSVSNLELSFGGLKALNQLSFTIDHSTIASFIGPNGAGKTSLINCISGFYRPTAGSISFDGQPIAGLRPNKITELGIVRTFQNLELVNYLTVIENLILGRHYQLNYGFFQALLFTKTVRLQEEKSREAVEEVLEMMDLQYVADRPVSSLSYGLQKKVEIARALVMSPKILLLDECMSGLDKSEKNAMIELIEFIRRDFDTSVVLIEHDMEVVMRLSEQVIVLNFGEVVATGAPAAIQKNQEVIDVYLGTAN